MSDKFVSWEDAVLWLKKQPDQKELVRACYYDDPLLESAKRHYNSTEWQAVRKVLSACKKGRALDIGAGRGISSYALARDGWSVTALEPDSSPVVGSKAIRKIAATGHDISVVEEFAEKLPFTDNRFDLVYGRAVMHHADDLDEFCSEVFRVLKPRGRFLFTREHVISRQADLRTFLDSHPLHFIYKGEHAHRLAEYKEALNIAGLTIRRIFAPYDSDINLFPRSKEQLRKSFSKRLNFNIPRILFDNVIIPLLNIRDKTPGRLFSFFGRKQ